MILVLVNLELSKEIKRSIITNCNNQTKQENMHVSAASALNNYCQETTSLFFLGLTKIFFLTNKESYD